VNSGLVFLDELVGDNLVKVTDLTIFDVTLGDLLGTDLTDIRTIVDKGLADATDLLLTTIDLGKLIQSKLTSLADLFEKKLLDLADLDQHRIDFQQLADKFAFGDATRIYFNDGTGIFSPGVDLSPDRFITRSIATGDVDNDGDIDVVAGNTATGS